VKDHTGRWLTSHLFPPKHRNRGLRIVSLKCYKGLVLFKEFNSRDPVVVVVSVQCLWSVYTVNPRRKDP
jgi:hypothetical protein